MLLNGFEVHLEVGESDLTCWALILTECDRRFMEQSRGLGRWENSAAVWLCLDCCCLDTQDLVWCWSAFVLDLTFLLLDLLINGT